MRFKVCVVVGARPNFMKVAPLWRLFLEAPDRFEPLLIHTGQHYDWEMSDVFFEDLGLPKPDHFLGASSGSHAEQTAKVMIEFEKVCLEEHPHMVVVVGDVNSTLACAISAKKILIPVAHVEAGLRSRDWEMPEEINRVLTDALSDLLFTPSVDASQNLRNEGIDDSRISFVGNVMIDSLVRALPRAESQKTYERFGLGSGEYGLVTLHRPSNVDDPATLARDLATLAEVEVPLIFPVHPRTRQRMSDLSREITESAGFTILSDPMGYYDFLSLTRNASFVLTDSGGIQEETTFLGIPCLTLRPGTERPITISEGTNQLVTVENLVSVVGEIVRGNSKKGSIPALWDGETASRIVENLYSFLSIRYGP